MLEARDLKKQFPSGEGILLVFEHLAFLSARGEFVLLTGRSGSGKSTLLYQLGLLDTPDEGDVLLDGASTAALTRSARTQMRLERFGYVFQDYGLLPEMSALDNVMVPLLMRGMSRMRARTAAQDALLRVGLQAQAESRPAKLSGGQQQRVSIARAIAHNPAYILADEPTANLDSESAVQILQLFDHIHRTGSTIIMVTHEAESFPIADRVLELRDRRLVDVTAEHSARPEARTSVTPALP